MYARRVSSKSPILNFPSPLSLPPQARETFLRKRKTNSGSRLHIDTKDPWGLGFTGLCRDITPIMENQMEKKMETKWKLGL